MRETVNPRQHVWVAVVDGDVVGYASLHDGFLTNLYVHPSYQRDGIGAALLTEVNGVGLAVMCADYHNPQLASVAVGFGELIIGDCDFLAPVTSLTESESRGLTRNRIG